MKIGLTGYFYNMYEIHGKWSLQCIVVYKIIIVEGLAKDHYSLKWLKTLTGANNVLGIVYKHLKERNVMHMEL